MSAVAPSRPAGRLAVAGAAVLAFACVALAVFDFFVTTSSTDQFTSTADYLYTLDGFPFVIGFVALVAGLRALHAGRDGRLGRFGFLVTTAGGAALCLCLAASLATRSENSLGPLYPLGSLVSFLGMILFAVASVRARVLLWWAGPALAVSWVVGGPVGDGGPLGFKASALVLAAVAAVVVALALRGPAVVD
ncbi:hypothetical protein [Streptomyces carpinensis]|uniref:hypothetical protein n=1 Tax=Streptomyces carpinensis TaxID=66369 RepID=UPI000A369EB8|nr:hypothetical protein [Streptomyces carpinensis]